MSRALRVGILTVSDRAARGERVDGSGDAIEAWCAHRGYEVVQRATVPDEVGTVTPTLLTWCDEEGLDLILTTGGTGVSPRDVTPEATTPVLERRLAGVEEAMRRRGLEHTAFAVLSRGLVGFRGATLVANLPGSTGGVRDGLAVLQPLVEHAVSLARGEDPSHETGVASDGEGSP